MTDHTSVFLCGGQWTRVAAGLRALVVLLALVLFGFCAWSGGLYGIQVPNRDFKRFEAQLREGRHVFVVDVVQDVCRILDVYHFPRSVWNENLKVKVSVGDKKFDVVA